MFIASAFRVMLRLIGIALVASFTPALLAQGSSPVADGYDPNANGNVYAVALQPDGKAIIAGEFSWVQPNGATSSTAHNNIARLRAAGIDNRRAAYRLATKKAGTQTATLGCALPERDGGRRDQAPPALLSRPVLIGRRATAGPPAARRCRR